MEKRKILILCHCSMRGTSIGLIGDLLSQFDNLSKEEYKIDLFDTNYIEEHKSNNYIVNRYYDISIGEKEKFIRKIPWFRSSFFEAIILCKLKQILHSCHYNLILLYNVPPYSNKIVKIAHSYGSKVALIPWGSEVLKAVGKTDRNLSEAFAETDYVVGIDNSNLLIKARNIYHVPNVKIKSQKPFLKGVQKIIELKGKYNRNSMTNFLGIPYSEYNIICGYSGCETQRHKLIIEAISNCKQSLPYGYQLVFPVTYAAKTNYVEELKMLCKTNGINSVFITNYMTDEQIAFIHLISDLFINIQPTDSGNAFMIEELFCGNHIITGRWLHYDQFEQYGIPYYLIDSPDDLSNALKNVFTGEMEPKVVPEKLKKLYAIPEGFDRGDFWREILLSV